MNWKFSPHKLQPRLYGYYSCHGISGVGHKSLEKGERVEYDLADDRGRDLAINLTQLGGFGRIFFRGHPMAVYGSEIL